MKYKVQYVNGKMAEFEADRVEVVEIGDENYLSFYNNRYGAFLGWFGIGETIVTTVKASAYWKVTTEEAKETLVEDDKLP